MRSLSVFEEPGVSDETRMTNDQRDPNEDVLLKSSIFFGVSLLFRRLSLGLRHFYHPYPPLFA